MSCVNNIPTEVKARRIVQCPGDDPVRVAIESQPTEFDHTILCEFNSEGIATGEQVIAIISYGNTGMPTFSYYFLSDGDEWEAEEGYTLASCGGSTGTAYDVEIQEMCEGGSTSFLRWFVIENGAPSGVSYDTTVNGVPYIPSGIETIGKCPSSSIALSPDGYSVTGVTPQVGGTDFPSQVESITVTSITDTVTVTTTSGSITIPEGGSYSWGGGTSEMINTESLTITGVSAGSAYTIHWEEPLT